MSSDPTGPTQPGLSGQANLREQARKRLQGKRDFTSHLVAYVVVNAFLVGIWAITDRGGYFWPIWVIGGWGIGLALHAWDTFGRHPITEADVDEELRRWQRWGGLRRLNRRGTPER